MNKEVKNADKGMVYFMERRFLFYIDGSYSDKTPDITGYGVAVYEAISDNQMLHEADIYGASDRFIESRQIGGECEAVLKALQYAIDNDISDVEIIYDYIGVEKWATFQWTAKKSVSQNYLMDFLDLQHVLTEKLKKQGRQLNLKWKHVKGHSNVTGNERADGLANKGRTA